MSHLGKEPTIEQMLMDLRYGTTNQEVKSELKQRLVFELDHRYKVQKVLNPYDIKQLKKIYAEHMR